MCLQNKGKSSTLENLVTYYIFTRNKYFELPINI